MISFVEQEPRLYGGSDGAIRYVQKRTIKILESGRCASSTRITAAEFKEIAWAITWEKWADEAAKQKDVKTIMDRILTNACAAINARCNMTIYLGVKDDGAITGILIENYDLVHTLNQILDEYLREPQSKAFRAKGKLKFSAEMRTAFSQCVGNIKAIPVDGTPPTTEGCYYVLEIDICPRYIFTRDLQFAFCTPEGRVVSYIRERSSNLPSTHDSFKDRNFKGLVQEGAVWRRDEDLKERLAELEREKKLVEENASKKDKKALKAYQEMIEAITAKLESGGDMSREELERVLSLDAIAAVREEAGATTSKLSKMKEWDVQAVLEITKAAFRTIVKDDLTSIATALQEEHKMIHK